MGLLDNIPDFGISGAGIANAITLLIIAVLILIIVIALVIGIIYLLRFNKKIIMFTDVNGKPEIVGRTRGTFITIKETGDTVLYLRRPRKYLPTPRIQTGRNTYWYFIREDQEWINIGLGDINEQFREIGARFLDTEMRYARTALQAKIKERYEKPGFWATYGTLIVNFGAIAIIMIFLWLIVDQLIDLAGTVNSAVDAAADVMEETKRILGSLDSIQSGGSGLT